MGMLERFSSIVKSNVNAVLDKMEDPAKMVDQMLRDAVEDLAIVKKETAVVMAEEKRCARLLNELQDEISKYMGLAEKAVLAGNDADAVVFLEKVSAAESKLVSATATHQAALENANKMRQMHDKLTADINMLKSRRAGIKANIAVAKTQQKINKMGNVSATDAVNKFNDYEAKAQGMLDRANAEAELNSTPIDNAADLASRYENGSEDAATKLSALKDKLGL